MLGIMRSQHPENASPEIIQAREELRFEAAKAAAPYVHPRLQSTTLAGDPDKPLTLELPIVAISAVKNLLKPGHNL
jgi:hypothetical protein